MDIENSIKSTKRKKLPVGALILIVIVVAFTVFLCSVISSDDSDPSPDVNNSQPSSAPATTQSTNKVLLENETIKATYMGVIDMPDISYFYVQLNINNNSDQEIWVTMESADVDGETVPLITTAVPVHIRSGNSYAATFGFPMLNLSIDSVKNAKQATFKLVARDKENISNILFESDLITIDLNQ